MKRFLFCAVLLLFGGRLQAQQTTAQITSHTNGQTVYSPNITITWKGCSNLAQTSYTTRVNGTAISTTQANSSIACPDFLIRKNYSASTTLTRNGNNDIYVSVCDGVHPCGEDSLHIVYAGPEVTVTPKNIDAPFVVHGAPASYPFKIRNTGGHTGLMNLAFSCSSELAPCSLLPNTTNGPITIVPGDSVIATLSYEGATAGAGTASVTATYTNFTGITDSGYVRVAVRDVPTSVVTSPGDGQTVTNPNITVAWKGCGDTAITSGAASLNGSSLGTPTQISGTACLDRVYSQNYSIPALLNPGANTISVSACDANNLCSAATTITVTYAPPSTDSVTVVPVQTPKTVAAGNATISFNVRYFSPNTPSSTFSLATVPAGSVTSCNSLSPVTLSAGAAATTIDVTCSISTVGDAGSVKLTATRTSSAAISNNGTTAVTINPVYRISIVPASANPTVIAGSTNTHSVQIRNTSSNASSAITVTLPSPSCSGITLGGCTVPSNTAQIAQDGQTSLIPLTYTALAAGSETVSLIPSGTVSGGTVQVTNGTLAVTVNSSGGSGSLSVVMSGRNPGTTIDKSGCLTIAAGQNAAYECGDLRIVHPLPATVTMDRASGPALIYNSRHANPGSLVAADVTYTQSTPDSLQATVIMAGQANIVRKFPWSSACATACRIVVPVSTTQATGLYPVTLQVSTLSGTTSVATGSASDTVVVVNRASSPYGSGWWIDGLESLITVSDTRMLWIGGDGSARLYAKTGNDTVFTVNPSYDRPDSLTRDTGALTWHRHLGDGAYVEFDNAGRHTRTKNALGWTTTFGYGNGFLDTITLPVPSGSPHVRSYKFWYTSSLLDSVQAPSASLSRTTSLKRTGSRVDSIIDPGDLRTRFAYDASNRITTRTNRLGDPTTFQYDDAGALKQSSLNMARTNGAGSAITTSFRAAETRSAYTAGDSPLLPSGIFTQLSGPRNVGDTTNIIVNRWGAPDSVTNALGQRTRITRANSSFPALATKVIATNGLETRAFYNARALTDSTIVVNPYDNGSDARTIYTWNSKWNQLDSLIGPENEHKRMFYRTNAPVVDSMCLGMHGRFVRFTYTADNQVRSTAEPGLPADSVHYDGSGNTSKTWTPVGRSASVPYFTEYVTDVIGRAVTVRSPISGDTIRTISYTYDAADRVIGTVDSGPARPYSLPLNPSFSPDTAIVQALTRTDSSAYDAEGNLVFKKSLSSSGDVQVNETLKYDAAGRLVKRSIGTGPDSLVYDAAGNVTSARQRSGAWVTQSFDVLNRLTSRVVPQVTHPQEACANYAASGPLTSTCAMTFPYYPNSGNDLLIPADTSSFAYDTPGNMTQASNRNARVRRTYYRNGALKTDTMSIGSVANPLSDGGTAGQQYSYDKSGRRTSMVWGFGTTSYTYDDLGLLATVTAPDSVPFRYTRTAAGRVDSLILGTGVREKRTYDADGRLTFRNRISDVLSPNLLVSDSLFYDEADHIVRATELVRNQQADQTRISYDGLGAVVAREQGNQYGSNVEEFRNDAFGNVLRRLTRKSAGTINSAPFVLSYSPKGELNSWLTQLTTPPASQYQRKDDLSQNFLSGRMTRQSEVVQNPNDNQYDYQLAARLYYGSDDRLMAVERYSWKTDALRDGTWEEYRYDALGRRVLTRVRRNGGSPYDNSATIAPLCQSTLPVCRSFTEMVWWDGDQALVENRTAEGTADVSNNGTVGNINGLTLDEPLAVYTTYPSSELRIINYNWRGQGLSSVTSAGAGADATTGGSAIFDWPAMTQAETYFTPSVDASGPDNTPRKWLGTFMQNGQGTTGMLYRRNRYFDPNTGRFTQEDPIGIAGGLNAYGFADGDPVNYADPFGLCPLCAAGLAVAEEAARGAIVGGITGTAMQLAANKIAGNPTWEGVGRAAILGAGTGAVTAGLGSVARIGKSISIARRAMGFEESAVASRAEANAAGEIFTGRPSRPIYDGRTPGKPQVGWRNNGTGNQYRWVHSDPGTPTPHANLQNAQAGNLHLEVNPQLRWFPWKW